MGNALTSHWVLLPSSVGLLVIESHFNLCKMRILFPMFQHIKVLMGHLVLCGGVLIVFLFPIMYIMYILITIAKTLVVI